MTLAELATVLSGSLSVPGSVDFDTARLFHGRAGDPAGVVAAADVPDVVAAIATATRLGLPVAVRGGGHSMWESLPGALVVDLRAMREVEVADAPGGAVVRIGGGATWGDVAEVLVPQGLAISSGDTRSVGVGGLTLGGGIGWVVRAWGLAVDQLVGAQLVTAGGDVLEVSAAEHADLFWALRGGGGNLGVVTRFDFVAHPLPGVVHAMLDFGAADLATLVRGFRDVMRAAPRELNGSLLRPPSMDPAVPPSTRLELAWAGQDEAAARAALAPLLELPGLVSAEVAPAPYSALLNEPPSPPPGMPMPTIVDQNGWLADLDDDAVDRLVACLDGAGAQMVLLRWLGGAFGDVAADATAVAFREAEAFVVAAAFAPPGAPADEVAQRQAALDPLAALSLGAYGNFTNSTDGTFASRMYPPSTLARLRELKGLWDPQNLFCRNHNVAP